MKNILVPTDFSEASGNALQYAMSVAKLIDAKVDILHVYSLPMSLSVELPADMLQQMLDNEKEQVEEQFSSFLQIYGHAEDHNRLLINGRFISQEIVEIAKDKGHDLIVMGMKGKHSSIEKVIGSITTQTMMQAPCPVMAIPEGISFNGIDEIAYATDFQLTDQHAVEELIAFAGVAMAKVHFLHVETKPNIGQLKDTIQVDNYPYDFTDFTIINYPSVMEGIDQYMLQNKVDLLALFIPRRRLWERLFHSSFTKKMCFHTKTPLLVFHS